MNVLFLVRIGNKRGEKMKFLNDKSILQLKQFYIFMFFAMGSVNPLLSVYLSDVENLNGYQIGFIMSLTPIITIFFQPIWGLIADKLKKPLTILQLTTISAAIFMIGYAWFSGFYLIVLVAVVLSVFQSAMIPLADSITVVHTTKMKYNYGNVRLFGSLGYAVAVVIMGYLSDMEPSLIFYGASLSLFVAFLITTKMPKIEYEEETLKQPFWSSLSKLLKQKEFILYLIITFLIFGPNMANNSYWGLLIEDVGGTYTTIGVMFFIAVISEIPFMNLFNKIVQKVGILNITLLAGGVALVRWIIYYSEPSLWLLYSTAVLQGVTIGFMIPAGLQFVKKIVSPTVAISAITIYSAVANGLGNWFSTFLSGIILENQSVYEVYLLYIIQTIIGLIIIVYLKKIKPAIE